MFKYKSSEDDLIKAMEQNLIANASEEAFGFNKIAKAIDYLNSAADLFDDVGMSSEAEYVTSLIEILASKDSKKSKKKTTKPKTPDAKKSKKTTKKASDPNANLTPEQMIENLKTNGTVFNMDCGDTVMMDDDSEEVQDSEEQDLEDDA